MSVLNVAVVVTSANRDTAVERYKKLLDADVLTQFDLPGGSFTVTVLPGISILSGSDQSLGPVRELRASVMVDSLVLTREKLERTGWKVDGNLGTPNSLIARDPDNNLIEFVETSRQTEAIEE
jgi:hypothetical protein